MPSDEIEHLYQTFQYMRHHCFSPAHRHQADQCQSSSDWILGTGH